ncbi:MAG: class I SAM-dependent methyltransferase [bacterium]|nr:class I SAM-dependent methyltransferase [bacterium]
MVDKYDGYSYYDKYDEVGDVDWEAYYTELGKSMPFEVRPDDGVQRRRARMRFAAAFDNLPDNLNTALDVGGGDGYFGQLLLEKRPDIRTVCFDLSRSRMEAGTEREGGVEFRAGDIYDLPFDDGAFELVTAFEVIEHLLHPQKALDEIARVCSGRVVITVPNDEQLTDLLCPHCLKRFPESGHLQRFDEKRLTEMAGVAGLKVIGTGIVRPLEQESIMRRLYGTFRRITSPEGKTGWWEWLAVVADKE